MRASLENFESKDVNKECFQDGILSGIPKSHLVSHSRKEEEEHLTVGNFEEEYPTWYPIQGMWRKLERVKVGIFEEGIQGGIPISHLVSDSKNMEEELLKVGIFEEGIRGGIPVSHLVSGLRNVEEERKSRGIFEEVPSQNP